MRPTCGVLKQERCDIGGILVLRRGLYFGRTIGFILVI
jgi:hypothetical protein